MDRTITRRQKEVLDFLAQERCHMRYTSIGFLPYDKYGHADATAPKTLTVTSMIRRGLVVMVANRCTITPEGRRLLKAANAGEVRVRGQ